MYELDPGKLYYIFQQERNHRDAHRANLSKFKRYFSRVSIRTLTT